MRYNFETFKEFNDFVNIVDVEFTRQFIAKNVNVRAYDYSVEVESSATSDLKFHSLECAYNEIVGCEKEVD
jgi:hypothetical protein